MRLVDGTKRNMMHQDVAQVLYDERQIAQRVAQLGAQIRNDYSGRVSAGESESLLAICILRGAAVFMADLIRNIDLPVQTEYVSASSYGNAAESSGVVDIKETLSFDIAGRHVLVVEDMVDSGITLNALLEYLRGFAPASLEVAAMLKKERADGQGANFEAKYTGFECPDEFIVGYGLDFAQRYRNLPYIAVLKQEIYK